MANNKVQLSDGTVLLDLTGDTVTPETLAAGVTAHDAAGNRIVGTGGGSAGFSMTFPATATNWTRLDKGSIVQADGTMIDMKDYSTLAGKTIPNIIEILSYGFSYNFLRMRVQTGKIMMTHNSPSNQFVDIAVDGELTTTFVGNGSLARWTPLTDTVISFIEMQNTD